MASLRPYARPAAVLAALASLAATGRAVPGVSVVFDPPAPVQGEPIEITLINGSEFALILPSHCLFQSVHPVDCAHPPILVPYCLAVLTFIPPGTTYSSVWDQKDGDGDFVAPGTYAFGISGIDCPTVVIGGSCSVPPETLGEPGHGSSFFEPRLETVGGMPVLGNAAFGLSISFALGGAPALLLLGAEGAEIAAPFGILHVSLAAPHVLLPLTLGGAAGVAGSGGATLPLPIPAVPALQGLSAYAQALIADPGGIAGVAATAGLHFAVCPN